MGYPRFRISAGSARYERTRSQPDAQSAEGTVPELRAAQRLVATRLPPMRVEAMRNSEKRQQRELLLEQYHNPQLIQSKSLDELIEMVQEIRANTGQDFNPWMILDWIIVLATKIQEVNGESS
jgi:hypothetical protein